MRLLALALLLVASTARADLSEADLATAAKLRDGALASPLAYELVTSLTTEVGSRMAGSPGDERAVAWAVANLKRLGFANVRAEAFRFSAWKRGPGHAEIVAPYPHRLVMTALGNSVPTPPGGLEAEVAYYPDLAALRADKSERARGKIVFIDQKTERRRFGATYGTAVAARTSGASEAAKRGAVASVIRSIGTDHDRLAHTGVMTYQDGIPRIPAIAVSIPDADLIARIANDTRAPALRLRLAVATEPDIPAVSHNVIAEIEGTDLAKDIVLIGAHLDSWDEGTGAIDDGAGVGIVVAAAKAILESGTRPRRTIRVVLFGNEEKGLDGSRAYGQKYKDVRHQMVGESDFGAGRPWRFSTRVAAQALPVMAQIATVLAPLDLAQGNNNAETGPDCAFLSHRHGWPALHADQDGSDYFNYHHTPNDTLDKVDPAALRPNVAAWAVMAWLAAQADVEFGPLPVLAAAQVPPVPAVDHHQHVFSPEMAAMLSSPEKPFPSVTGKDVVALLDEAGIKRGVLLSVAYLYSSPSRSFADESERVRKENDWTAEQAARYPDRLVAFCSVNPLKDYALAEIDRCAGDKRFGKGLKLHLGNSDVQLADPDHVRRLGEVFKRANERRMALVIHARSNIGRKRPYGVAEARALLHELIPLAPDVTVQIAHLAGTGPGFEDPPAQEVLAALAEAFERHDFRLENVYLDVASNAHPENPPEINELIVKRMRQVGVDRILYGTDSSAGGNLTPAQSWRAFSRLPFRTDELARIAQNVAPYLRP